MDYCQAVNDEGGEVNDAFDHATSSRGTIPAIAKSFKARAQPWALIVDENYGEGSAREHAALQPRFYGAFAYLGLTISHQNRVCLDCCPFFCSNSRDKPQGESKFYPLISVPIFSD